LRNVTDKQRIRKVECADRSSVVHILEKVGRGQRQPPFLPFPLFYEKGDWFDGNGGRVSSLAPTAVDAGVSSPTGINTRNRWPSPLTSTLWWERLNACAGYVFRPPASSSQLTGVDTGARPGRVLRPGV
jgi:hypothetical protein